MRREISFLFFFSSPPHTPTLSFLSFFFMMSIKSVHLLIWVPSGGFHHVCQCDISHSIKTHCSCLLGCFGGEKPRWSQRRETHLYDKWRLFQDSRKYKRADYDFSYFLLIDTFSPLKKKFQLFLYLKDITWVVLKFTEDIWGEQFHKYNLLKINYAYLCSTRHC